MAALWSAAALFPAAAQAAPAEDAADAAQVPETVIITARPPDPVGNEAFSVMQLDSAQLQASSNLDEALSQVPGLSLFRRNSSLSANPTTQGVSLRSIAPSGAGRALVTLDGVPQNDPFGGWVIWSSLPAEDIASAEIVRGAGAGPYGAGALTGVIALSEHEETGLVAAEASGGERKTGRLAASGGAQLGEINLFGSASYETTGGWVSVSPEQRGPADNALTLDAKSASLRAEATPFDGTTLAVRAGVYDEIRDAGLVGTGSEAKGISASMTLAHPESPGALGWRLQTWLRDTNFSNTSASVAALRAFTTPSNDEYSTPALGWGVNAALRGRVSSLGWEVGADGRFASGESRELSNYVSGAFTQRRVSGGNSFVGGLYAEAADRFDGWLLTAGVRADEWTSTNSHITQANIATGAFTLQQYAPGKSGTVPTARLGVRKDVSEGLYLRSAAYAGFRAPSLNELYRPYRLANNITEANPGLEPEKLYGVEVGLGGKSGAFSWDATAFWNKLQSAITNVTVAQGPGNFPGVGMVPAGGLLIQRQNAGDITAPGVEGDAQWQVDEAFALRGGLSFSDAHVDGGTAAPQLTGKRPQQAPRWTVTGGVVERLAEEITLSAQFRYESARFADDQNTLKLGSAVTIDAKAQWNFTPELAIYIAADNLLNANVATNESADFVTNLDAPRIVRIGITYAQ